MSITENLIKFNLNHEKDSNGRIFIEFKSNNGEFKFLGEKIRLESVVVRIGDDILIEGITNDKISKIDTDISLHFFTDDGWEIELPKCAIQERKGYYKFKASCNKIQAKKGVFQKNELLKQYRLIENLKFEWYSKFDKGFLSGLEIIPEKFYPFPFASGFFVIEDTFESIQNKWTKCFDNLFYLLSFYSSNFVNLRVSFIEGHNYREFIAEPLRDKNENGVSNFLEYQIFEFLNSSYDNFEDKKDKLNLGYVINYYIWMKQGYFIEVKYLMGSVLLETLKHAYATRYKEYEKEGKYFLKPKTKELYSFKELVYEMFSEFDIDINKFQNWINNTDEQCINGLKSREYYSKRIFINEICSSHNIMWKESFIEDIIGYRNEILHSGKIESELAHLYKLYKYLENSIELLLIKILEGNHGYYGIDTNNFRLNK